MSQHSFTEIKQIRQSVNFATFYINKVVLFAGLNAYGCLEKQMKVTRKGKDCIYMYRCSMYCTYHDYIWRFEIVLKRLAREPITAWRCLPGRSQLTPSNFVHSNTTFRLTTHRSRTGLDPKVPQVTRPAGSIINTLVS